MKQIESSHLIKKLAIEMKIALISFFASLVAINASFLPQSEFNISKHDVDTLIKDMLRTYRDIWKAKEPISIGSAMPEIPIQTNDVDVILAIKQAKLKIGESANYSESSSLTESELSATASFSMLNANIEGKLIATGTVKGQPIEQTGHISLSWENCGYTVGFEIHYDDKSVTLTGLQAESRRSPTIIQVSGIHIDGVTPDKGANVVRTAVDLSIGQAEEEFRQNFPIIIDIANKQMTGHTLREVYDYFRSQVPKDSI